MPISPQSGSDAVTTCRVLLAGLQLADSVETLEMEVQSAVGQLPSARVVLADGNMPTGDWPLANTDTYLPGTEIEIQAGHGDTLSTIFKGLIVRMGVSIDADNRSCLTLDCRDKAVAMTLTRRNAVYLDQTDSAVMETLINQAGLAAAVDSTAFTHKELVQFNCSDWDFVLARAQANGLLLIAEDGTLNAKAPVLDGEPALKITWGENLCTFNAQLEARQQPAQLKTAAGGQAEQTKAAPARVRGTVRFQGSALAKLGGLLQVSGVGERFAGKLLIERLEHSIAEGLWMTEVGFGLGPQWPCASSDVIASPNGARLPGASNGSGSFVLPEVGDEVLVGFFGPPGPPN